MYLTIRWLMGAYLPQIDRNYWWPVWLLSGPVCQRIGAAPPGVSLVPLSSLSSLKEKGILHDIEYIRPGILSVQWGSISDFWDFVYTLSLYLKIIGTWMYINKLYTWMTIKSRKSPSRKWLPDKNLKETYACSCSCTVFFQVILLI